nr:hypothetical protein [Tanacetum cinerariifolium]
MASEAVNRQVAKSRITCVNTNGNTMLSEAQGVSLRITFSVRFHRRPPAKGVGLRVADSHTSNHPEDDFTPLETIQRSYSVIRERIPFELEGETFEPERGVRHQAPQSNVMYASMNALLLTQSANYSKAILNVQAPVLFALNDTLRFTRKMDFMSFMIQGVNGEFNFLLEGGFKDNQGSFSVKSVNNETSILDVKPISAVLPSNVADNIINSSNISFDDELPLVRPPHPLSLRARRTPVQASKVDGDASTPLDVDSDPDIHEFPSAKELKDTTNCQEVKRDKAYAELEEKCNEALQDLDKNPFVSDMLYEIETLQGQEIDWLRQDRAAVVSKVIPDATMKLVHSDEIGVLVARLVRTAIFHGRCTTFEEIAKFKEPFFLEKMPGYRMSSKDEYDRAGEDMANASFPFLSEFTLNPYAFVE